MNGVSTIIFVSVFSEKTEMNINRHNISAFNIENAFGSIILLIELLFTSSTQFYKSNPISERKYFFSN